MLDISSNVMNVMPSLGISARALAKRTARRRKALIALRLTLVTTAAVFGTLAISGHYSRQRVDYAGVAGVLAFIGVLGVRLTMQSDPDLDTAEPRARAVADLVASHAWRYAVGGRPYTVGSPELDRVANRLFSGVMVDYQEILKDYSVTAPVSRQITDAMKDIRAMSLQERRETYILNRIEPLQKNSSNACIKLARRWRLITAAVLLVELFGIPGGVLKAISLSSIDVLGVTAAAAASLALWADTLAYPARERSATTVGKSLVAAHDDLMDANTEYEWTAAVARIEDRLSLEAEALLASDSSASRRAIGEDDIHAMSPDEYFAAAATLKRQIWDGSSKLPKLEPDVVVAVNPGGAILGGMLYFMTRASDFLPLSLRAGLREEDLETMLKAAPWQPRKPQHLSILLVDASVKSGDSLNKAIGLVRNAIESKGYVAMDHGGHAMQADAPRYVLRTAVIAKKPDPAQSRPVQVDYYVNEDTERFPYGTI